MLVAFPIGLLGASVVFDLMYHATKLPDMAVVAPRMIVNGLVGGELVDRLGIGVYDDAHPDVPSSLEAGKHAPGR